MATRITSKHLGIGVAVVAGVWLLWPQGATNTPGVVRFVASELGQGLPAHERYVVVTMHEWQDAALSLDADRPPETGFYDDGLGDAIPRGSGGHAPGRPAHAPVIAPRTIVRNDEGRRGLFDDGEDDESPGLGVTSWGWVNDSVQAAERSRRERPGTASFADPFRSSPDDPFADAMLTPSFDQDSDARFPGLGAGYGAAPGASTELLFPNQAKTPDPKTAPTPSYSSGLW